MFQPIHGQMFKFLVSIKMTNSKAWEDLSLIFIQWTYFSVSCSYKGERCWPQRWWHPVKGSFAAEYNKCNKYVKRNMRSRTTSETKNSLRPTPPYLQGWPTMAQRIFLFFSFIYFQIFYLGNLKENQSFWFLSNYHGHNQIHFTSWIII